MQYRPFGNTGIHVSTLGFGAMRLPAGEDKKVDLEKSIPMLRRGIDLGINYIDTAYVYIDGTSEVAVGQAVKAYDREKLFLATKIPVHTQEDGAEAVWRAKLETCLKRFDTPYIDFIHFHGLSWAEFDQVISKPGMALAAARRAQSEGLVRHISFSSHDSADNIIHLIDTHEFASLLVQYNYLDRHNEPAIVRAHQAGMGVAVMGPVAGGRLANPAVMVDDESGIEVKTPELALRFVWNNPGVSVALSGMNAMTQIEENCTAAGRAGTMNDREHEAIRRLLEKNQKLADLYCTGCAYCMPCPNDVQIPENFRYMNWARVWGLEEDAKKAYSRLTGEGTWTPWAGPIKGLKADACLQCGECEPKCPQNIHIMDQLVEVAQALGA